MVLTTQLPSGRVTLDEKHTLVAGGLSSILQARHRAKILKAADSGSRAVGAVLFAVSRLLILYFTHLISNDLPVPSTTGDHEGIFTQELLDYAMAIFKSNANFSAKRDSSPAYQLLVELANQQFGGGSILEKFGKHNCSGLTACLHSWAKIVPSTLNNHLIYACEAHTSLYVKAKYSHLYLRAEEARQLARTIGRSVQWNANRTAKRRGVEYNKLPRLRPAAQLKTIRGEEVLVPAMTEDEWREIVDAERELLPPTWSQLDMLKGRLRMLQEIRNYSTPELSFKAFTILPTFSAGRTFLKLNTAGLHELVSGRAGVSISKVNILDVFVPERLDRLMRHPRWFPSENTQPLMLGGEFFRTDGVQAQFYCGLGQARGTKRSFGGDDIEPAEEDHADPDEGWDAPEPDEPDPEERIPLVERPSLLFSDDPGTNNIINIGTVDESAGGDPVNQRTGDGLNVKVTLGYRLSARRWAEMRGFHRARRRRKGWTEADGYKAAMVTFSQNSAAESDEQRLGQHLVAQCGSWRDVNAVEGSRKVARLRFNQFMRTQKAMAQVKTEVFEVLGKDGVLALGSGNWKHRGRTTAASQMIHNALRADPRARLDNGRNRIFLEPETNSSCKCSRCLGPLKMVQPKHAKVYGNATVLVDGFPKKVRMLIEGGSRPHGLYQCTQPGCYRTWERDRNAITNIWRSAWERMHGRPRPATLTL